jgi:hypothetical protein
MGVTEYTVHIVFIRGIDMKVGDQVIVKTSQAFIGKVGVVSEITNQGRVVVRYGEHVGFYTIGKDEFEVVPL